MEARQITGTNGRKGGRPSIYSDAMADHICEMIANGQSLATICKKWDTPSVSTVFRWLEKMPGFREDYARARECQGDKAYSEIIDIEKDLANKKIDAQSARVLIDSKKWRAGKMQPSVYGDLTRIAGHDAGPLTVSHQVERAINAQRAADQKRRQIEARRNGDDPDVGEDELTDDEVVEAVYPVAAALPKTH